MTRSHNKGHISSHLVADTTL